MSTLQVSSLLCRGLCYYLYLRRYGLLDNDGSSVGSTSQPRPLCSASSSPHSYKLWDCIDILDLEPALSQKLPLKSVASLVKNLKSTLGKANDKCDAIDAILEYVGCADACSDLVECHSLLQSILELLRVSATLFVRIALQFETSENVEIIRNLRTEFPQKPNFDTNQSTWLEAFADIPFARSGQTLGEEDSSRVNPKTRKLYAESLSLEETLLGLMKRFYTLQRSEQIRAKGSSMSSPANTYEAHPQPRATIQWDLEATLIEADKKELDRIRDDLLMMQSLQHSFSSEVVKSKDPLDETEANISSARMYTQESSVALVGSARTRSRTWTLEGGIFGAFCGAITGLLAGPVGAAVGIAAGGALGGVTGQALKSRQRNQLAQLEESLQHRISPQTPSHTHLATTYRKYGENDLRSFESDSHIGPMSDAETTSHQDNQRFREQRDSGSDVRRPRQCRIAGCATLPVTFPTFV